MAYHALSRLRPFTIMCFRKTPSNVNPKRSAARRDATLRTSHFHSTRPVAEVVEGVTAHQIDRLGRGSGALERDAEPDVADLDHGVGGDDPQVRRHPQRLPALDREEQRVLGYFHLRERVA